MPGQDPPCQYMPTSPPSVYRGPDWPCCLPGHLARADTSSGNRYAPALSQHARPSAGAQPFTPDLPTARPGVSERKPRLSVILTHSWKRKNWPRFQQVFGRFSKNFRNMPTKRSSLHIPVTTKSGKLCRCPPVGPGRVSRAPAHNTAGGQSGRAPWEALQGPLGHPCTREDRLHVGTDFEVKRRNAETTYIEGHFR